MFFMLRSTHNMVVDGYLDRLRNRGSALDESRAAQLRLGAALSEALKERDEARAALDKLQSARARSNANLAAANEARKVAARGAQS